MKLFELFATLGLETSDFDKGIRGATATGESFAENLGAKVSAGTIALGKLMADVVEKTVSTITTLGKQAFSLYGEMEQNIGGSMAVFGQYAETLQEKSKTAYKEMGLSQSEFLAEANIIGSILQGMGYSQSEAMEMSTSWMQRAADMASVMGIDVSMAMKAIENASKSNYMLMDNLGVAMNVATLSAYAEAKGIDAVWETMTYGEKIAIAYQMFMERTADYAGNYARENDTLTGSLNSLRKAFADLITGAGTPQNVAEMMDLFISASVNAAENVIPKLIEGLSAMASAIGERLPDIMEKLSPIVKQAIGDLMSALPGALADMVSGAAQAIAYLFNSAFGTSIDISYVASNVRSFVNDIVSFVSDNAGIIMGIVAAIGVAVGAINLPVMAAVAAVGLIITNWELVKAAVVAAWEAIKGFFTETIPAAFSDAIHVFALGWEAVKAAIVGAWEAFIDFVTITIPQAFEGAISWIAEKWEAIKAAVGAAWDAVVNFFTQTIPDYISGVIEGIKNWWDDVQTAVNNAWDAVVRFFTETIPDAITAVIQSIIDIWDGVTTAVGNAWDAVVRFFTETIPDAITSVIQSIIDIWDSVTTAISNAWDAVVKFFTETIPDSITAVIQGIIDIWNSVTTAVGNAWDKVVAFFNGNGITDAITGVVKGIKTTWDNVTSSIKSAIDKAREFFGLESSGSSVHKSSTGSGSSYGGGNGLSFSNTASMGSSISAKMGGGGQGLIDKALGFATGLDYVPYDEYPARLHEGEAVLTKLEAENWRRGEGAQQPIDYNALGQIVASAVTNALQGLSVNIDGKAAGAILTEPISRNIADLAYAGRYAL